MIEICAVGGYNEVGKKFYEKCMLLIFTKKYDADYVMFRDNEHQSYTPKFINEVSGNWFLFYDRVNSYSYKIMTLDTFLRSLTFEEYQTQFNVWKEKYLTRLQIRSE